jgi:WD40 repeat protein
MRTVLAISLACGACGSAAHTYNAAPDEGPAEPRLVVTARAEDDADTPRRVLFTPDGRYLLAITGVIGVWEFDAAKASLQERGWFGFAADRVPPPSGLMNDPAKLEAWLAEHVSVREAVITPDGEHVIGGGRGALAVWRLTPEATPVATLVGVAPATEHEMIAMALAPDGRALLTLRRLSQAQAEAAGGSLTAMPQGTIELWEVARESSVPLRKRGEQLVRDMPYSGAFTADGRFAAVVGSDEMLAVVAVKERGGPQVFEQEADDTLQEIVALTDDRFATGGFDQVVRVWRLERGETPRLVQQAALDQVHAGKLRALAAAPDSSWLVAASDDHTLSLWPAGAWAPGGATEPVVQFQPPDEYVHSLAVHPVGPWLATASDELRVWRVNREKLSEGAGARP